MFTGIIQAISPVLSAKKHESEWKIQVQRPVLFSNLKVGDSVALNGVCLTVELLTAQSMGFHLGFETLELTNWGKINIEGQWVNLELALRMGDFMGGHLVTGHVDGLAKVLRVDKKQASWLMEVQVSAKCRPYFWKKAFICLNGVSLTINEVKGDRLCVCLVPETLKRTNLKYIKAGDKLTFEVDLMARAFISHLKKT